jgi:hypothetical protein
MPRRNEKRQLEIKKALHRIAPMQRSMTRQA